MPQVPPGGYHVTVRFKKATGPDYAFDKAFCRLGPQRVVLTACYWKEDNCFCLCTLTPEMNKLVQYGKTPHVSMAINGSTDWKHLNQSALYVKDVTDWRPDEQKVLAVQPFNTVL